MRIASRQFSPKLWAVLLYVAVLSCMLWLGNWQLERAALKVSLQQAAVAAQTTDAVPLQSIKDIDAAASAYQRVSVTGRYDPVRQFLWDNRIHNSQAGFEVISLLKLETGQWVLVNRGWITPGASRQQLPEVALTEEVVKATITLEGLASQPSQGFASGPAVVAREQWPQLLQYFDYQQITEAVGEPVLPVVVQAQALAIDGKSVDVPSPRPEWLQANWQPAASGPATHYSYAFQWFAMALALTIIFLVVNIRKDESMNERYYP